MMMSAQYGFPEVAIRPGESTTIKIDTNGDFRPQRLVMVGLMAEIRGHFKIKRATLSSTVTSIDTGRTPMWQSKVKRVPLPWLNREDVIAYSNVTRIKAKRRTTIVYQGFHDVARSYLPESVVYRPVDPLHYIVLTSLASDKAPQLAGRVSARLFGPRSLGVGIPMQTARKEVSMSLVNTGDVRVQVVAQVFGYQRPAAIQ
jgi:hypothetical protein